MELHETKRERCHKNHQNYSPSQKYKSVLLDGQVVRNSMRSITCKGHKVSIEEVNKIALSPFDNKRYYYDDDGIRSLAYGHYRIGQKRKMISSPSIHLCAVDESLEKRSRQVLKLKTLRRSLRKTTLIAMTRSQFPIQDYGVLSDADIVDWEALEIENTYRDSPYIFSEAVEDRNHFCAKHSRPSQE